MHKFLIIFLLVSSFAYAQKTVYIPSYISNDPNIDLNDCSSQWCFERSIESENVVIFWEPGFGDNPGNNNNAFYVNLEALLQQSEETYQYYIDTLKFVVKGQSVTDQYKLMIFLLYTTDWAAYGSGQDDLVGSLHINPAAARIRNVVDHEIGHCFQYITGCDTQGGYRYGFGPNGRGGNGFWEQCAQWMAFQINKDHIFDEALGYANQCHLNILHEEPRYQNYFITAYWAFKNGDDIIGKLWRSSIFPEDPVETYKRIKGMQQIQFNDEIYEHASKLTTWDLPVLNSKSNDYINVRVQPELIPTNDEQWQIGKADCPQNYGYNCIKLNVPNEETTVGVTFTGLAGAEGYNNIHVDEAGWKFGFVALLKNGDRVYSDKQSAWYANGKNPENVRINFQCPSDCDKLWFVVTGAPQQHRKHEWDDDTNNDEQWPYKVKFENTEVLGNFKEPIHDASLHYTVEMEPRMDYSPNVITLDEEKINKAFAMSSDGIANALDHSIQYYAVKTDGTFHEISTAVHPGHWFNAQGNVINWADDQSLLYSELNLRNMVANIGQYPNRATHGDTVTIRQVLVLTKSETESATVDFTFEIRIIDPNLTGLDEDHEHFLLPFPNPTTSFVHLPKNGKWVLFDATLKQLSNGTENEIDMRHFTKGMYFIQMNQQFYKIVKQ